MNCPHRKSEYDKVLCKVIKFQAGDKIQTFANYVLQVQDPFDYIGQDPKFTELHLAEFLPEAWGDGHVYEILLARIQTRIQS